MQVSSELSDCIRENIFENVSANEIGSAYDIFKNSIQNQQFFAFVLTNKTAVYDWFIIIINKLIKQKKFNKKI